MSSNDGWPDLRKVLLASTMVAAGLVISGRSLAEIAVHNLQIAQATQPLQSTPGAETKPSAPAVPATTGTPEPAPQPAHEAQKEGQRCGRLRPRRSRRQLRKEFTRSDDTAPATPWMRPAAPAPKLTHGQGYRAAARGYPFAMKFLVSLSAISRACSSAKLRPDCPDALPGPLVCLSHTSSRARRPA
jgi:hypothetical protein